MVIIGKIKDSIIDLEEEKKLRYINKGMCQVHNGVLVGPLARFIFNHNWALILFSLFNIFKDFFFCFTFALCQSLTMGWGYFIFKLAGNWTNIFFIFFLNWKSNCFLRVYKNYHSSVTINWPYVGGNWYWCTDKQHMVAVFDAGHRCIFY